MEGGSSLELIKYGQGAAIVNEYFLWRKDKVWSLLKYDQGAAVVNKYFLWKEDQAWSLINMAK